GPFPPSLLTPPKQPKHKPKKDSSKAAETEAGHLLLPKMQRVMRFSQVRTTQAYLLKYVEEAEREKRRRARGSDAWLVALRRGDQGRRELAQATCRGVRLSRHEYPVVARFEDAGDETGMQRVPGRDRQDRHGDRQAQDAQH